MIAVLVIAGMSGAILALTVSSQHEHRSASEQIRAMYAAEAGVSHALDELVSRGSTVRQTPVVIEGDHDPFVVLGSSGAPLELSVGGYWADIQNIGDGNFAIHSTGESGRSMRSLEAVLRRNESPVYDNALYAGNSSGDPNYVMNFGGVGGQADQVDGDVYSGGSIALNGDSRITGTARATGTVSGTTGEEGSVQSIPDIAGMDYAHTADYDVAAHFASATWLSSSFGGSAWQLPREDPAHIFRKNPNDRTTDTAATAKDDYFLEDPYDRVVSSVTANGSDASKITISGTGSEPGENGNDKVYYIDGNLWLHNRNLYGFRMFTDDGSGARVTFVVRGNVYFSDNLFYSNEDRDGVAFIAIKDPNERDSGNIYFGDPVFGTLEEMHAFMYAENNFYDNNLNAAGSARVRVFGNMTAGNQVVINRDFGRQHSQLRVDFDSRIKDGDLQLPGLPTAAEGESSYEVVSWREIETAE